ncbi:HPF/RaiA family ribosome-associated protein [Pseudomonadota bacterium]
MKISIQCKGFSLTSAIAGQVHKRLQRLLGQGIRRMRRVDIILSELNGPGGSVDKRCLIKVSIDGLLPVVIDDIQSDLYIAIDRAADRASRTVLRRMALDNSRRRAEAQRWLAEQKQRGKQAPVAA